MAGTVVDVMLSQTKWTQIRQQMVKQTIFVVIGTLRVKTCKWASI